MPAPSTIQAFTDAAADAVGREIASLRKEAQRERELRDAEHRARMAELETRLLSAADLERRLSDRLVALKDGEPGPKGDPGADGVVDPAEVRSIVIEEIAALPPPERGEPGDRGPPGSNAEPITDEQIALAVGAALEPHEGRLSPLADQVQRWMEVNPPQPGKDADPEEIARQVADGIERAGIAELVGQQVAEAVSAIPAPEKGDKGDPGQDVDLEAVERQIVETVERAVEAIPKPRDGEPGRDGQAIERIELAQDGATLEIAFVVGEERSAFDVELPAGPPGANGQPGAEGPAGKMPLAKAWTDRVHYEGDVVTLSGSTYQALCDTGRSPPSDDWAMLAERGADGAEARELTFRGTFAAENDYDRLNVVALNGASFVAKHDLPGPCPGEGWQLIAAQGKRGAPGERGLPGPKGDQGKPGPVATSLKVDDEGLLTLTNADGSAISCDLYPLLSKVAR